jgi:hypothetical protein
VTWKTPWLTPRTAGASWLEGRASRRKLRLWAVAACRLCPGGPGDARAERALAASERYADGEVGLDELRAARQPLLDSINGDGEEIPLASEAFDACAEDLGFGDIASSTITLLGDPDGAAGRDLVREVFGNPFRPVRAGPGWRTPAVVGLASGVYRERAFDLLPTLADALLDAGCAEPAIQAHCRRPGGHVRGCWVIDWLLGKD